MIELNVQSAILNALEDDASVMYLVKGVYDDVQQSLDSGLADDFPYITIGDDNAVEWDTDTELGAEITLSIHVWSRFRGRSQAKEIQSAIYKALHRAKLTIACYNNVGIEFRASEIFLDSDGKTRHGVQTFTITIEG